MSQYIVAAVTLGTRGDVQPVAAVAWQLAQQLSSSRSRPLRPEVNSNASSQHVLVTFITHAAHQPWLEQLNLSFHNRATGQQLQLLYISSLPAAVWHASEGTAHSKQDASPYSTSQVRLGPVVDKPAAAALIPEQHIPQLTWFQVKLAAMYGYVSMTYSTHGIQ